VLKQPVSAIFLKVWQLFIKNPYLKIYILPKKQKKFWLNFQANKCKPFGGEIGGICSQFFF
jgi:hypothetical protein